MNLIVAVDKNWGIGAKNGLLYNLKQDMKYFRDMTMGKIVVMGRNTLESFPSGKPLKNRTNICVNDKIGFERDGVLVVTSLDELFETLKNYDTDNVFVIGGASIYKQLLPYCKNAYITKIEDCKPAEVFFPNLDKDANWVVTECSEPRKEEDTTFYFCKYENKNVREYN